MKSKRTSDILKKEIKNYSLRIKKLLQNIEPYTYEEYMAYALQLALQSLQEGNYGIGAVVVFRTEGIEYIIAGKNLMFSKKDSSLHAERGALHKFEILSQKPSSFKSSVKTGSINTQDVFLKRAVPHKDTKIFLVTTLEPCAGCYQEVLIHNTFGIKIDQIFSGGEHSDSGSSHHFRSKNLPSLWKRMAQEQNVTIFTLWNNELYELSLDIFNAKRRLHRNYYKKNVQESKIILENIKKLHIKSYEEYFKSIIKSKTIL